MASGWASDDAVNQQIESTISDAIKQVRSRINQATESAIHCEDCGEMIPLARRHALKGVRYCIDCQTKRDMEIQQVRSLYNRRGSKDSQLR
ncbi:MAG: DksA/TraR family C4-type zinc finger protein [Candidatus Schmidhempelia sp.]|nr:DksA/TraR family C4-type zinc finger protein [Candidatus Schmidhempelia sp.]